MEFTINKICSSCNKDFEMKGVHHNAGMSATYTNFENCPHCGERNDTWIKVNWPDSTKQT